MAQVLIGGVQGPIGAEVPYDVVRNGPPNQSTLGQEGQVHSGLIVELKGLAHVHLFQQGIRSNTPLYALPFIGESIVEELEVLMFKVLPTKYLHMPQPTQCGQGHWKKACRCCLGLEDHQDPQAHQHRQDPAAAGCTIGG